MFSFIRFKVYFCHSSLRVGPGVLVASLGALALSKPQGFHGPLLFVVELFGKEPEGNHPFWGSPRFGWSSMVSGQIDSLLVFFVHFDHGHFFATTVFLVAFLLCCLCLSL